MCLLRSEWLQTGRDTGKLPATPPSVLNFSFRYMCGVHAYLCRSLCHRSTLAVCLYCSCYFLLRPGLSLKRELTNQLDWLAVSPGGPPGSTTRHWDYRCAPRFHMGAGDPNPGACVFSTLCLLSHHCSAEGRETVSGNRVPLKALAFLLYF